MDDKDDKKIRSADDTTRTASAFRVKDKAIGGGIVGQEKHASSLPTFTFSRARTPLQPMPDIQYHSFDTLKSEIGSMFLAQVHWTTLD